ncbi:MAG TPA: Calx-beta domain-containing protein [Verrucomicrobiae bacterium]|nr:Calx-beta domain-containing protein [Verrucomicrobiae bacterium]
MRRLRNEFFVPVWRTIICAGILISAALGATSALAQPANDNFANATDLNLFDVNGSGTNLDNNSNATLEQGEPTILTNIGGASVWYTWTAPSNGVVTFSTSGASFTTLLGVYLGNNVSNLTLIGADNGSHAGNSQVSFIAIAGTKLDITVDGTNGAQGPFTLTWKTVAISGTPTNDNFANAITNTGSSGTVFGDNINATVEAKEPPIIQTFGLNAGGISGASIWYAWTAPIDGVVTINTKGSTFDTVLGVFVGTNLAKLGEVAANDDFNGLRSSQVSFLASAGKTYMIDVAGYMSLTNAGVPTNSAATSAILTNTAMGFVVLNWNLGPLPLNDNFANATFLGDQLSGSISGNNFGATTEPNEPSHAGFAASQTVWYSWTATVSGDVEMDTIGSSFDTVLAVYTGTSIPTLVQAAANDDLYPTLPIPGSGPELPQENEEGENSSISSIPSVGVTDTNQPTQANLFNGVFGGANFNPIEQPFSGLPGISTYGSGASELHFTATAGTTYYIAVGSKGSAGPFMLNWAYHPSGVFRFASETIDGTSGVPEKGTSTRGGILTATAGTENPAMLLYQVSETESDRRTTGNVNGNQENSTIYDGYTYDQEGLLVTVTRVAGSAGRVTVGIGTVDGDQLSDHYSVDPFSGLLVSDGVPIPLSGDAPAHSFNGDYGQVLGTLTFNDFEMSKTILIPIGDDGGLTQPNRDFGIVLFDPQVDPSEPGAVSQPRVDPVFSQALVRILDCDIDPRGPSQVQMTNSVTMTNAMLGSNVTVIVTNIFYTLTPTNPVFNFQKSYYRVPEDVTNFLRGIPITVYVNRMGTNTDAATVSYRINNVFLGNQDLGDQANNEFPLEPGSDYAIPDVNGANGNGKNQVANIFQTSPADFGGAANGTLSFPSGAHAHDPQPVTFTVFENSLTEFNRDFQIELYATDSQGNPYQVGMVAQTTVTILFDDANPPAGSVDELYNPDFGLDLVVPAGPQGGQPLEQPGTDANGQVNALVVLPNNESVIGGSFSSYNGVSINGVALIQANGQLDTNFNPGEGLSITTGDFVTSLGLQPNGQIIVAGSFTSFAGTSAGNIVRVNANGSIDTAFLAASGSGANGPIRSMIVDGDGTIVIGGDFTAYNGQVRNHVARLNSNGSLDSTFDPGTGLNGSVYAMTPVLPPVTTASAVGTNTEMDTIINTGTSGILSINYDSIQQTNDLRVYYGPVLIFDTQPTNTANAVDSLVIPFGPIGGITNNTILIVVNQNVTNGVPGFLWDFSAKAVSPSSSGGVIVGGDFTAAGGNFGQDHIARLLGNGSVDPSFDFGSGANARVRALATQENGQLIVGGDFTFMNGQPANFFVRLNSSGSLDTQFFSGSGTDGSVYSIVDSLTFATNTSGTNALLGTNVMVTFNPEQLYIGGPFTEYNGTHRLGFSRINIDGSVDTTFLDTAYNQFAGLTRIHFGDIPNAVYTSGVQSDGNVMIGGSFSQVGGGQFDPLVRPDSFDFGQLTEPKSRDGVRNRNSVTRLIGGSTPGPGSVGFLQTTYPTTKSAGFEYVTLTRTNGSLGYASANFNVVPGSAQAGSDFNYAGNYPLYPIEWEYFGTSRRHSDGLWGTNTVYEDNFGGSWTFNLDGPGSVIVTINNNQAKSGNVAAQFQLANPAGADQFYLGGENIPLGVGLGRSIAPLNIVDDNKRPGTFGFSSPTYSGVGSVPITVIRTNGQFNSTPLQIGYSTSAGPNTTPGVDYVDTAGTLTFNNGDTNKFFNVLVIQSNYISSIEKTVNLSLFGFPANAGIGLTNAILRIINPNYHGILNFSTNSYATNLSAGSIQFVVERNVGSLGTLDVQYATTNGTAMAGVDYIGLTNTLHWNSGDVSSRTVTVPLINNGNIGGSKTFGVYLLNGSLNGLTNSSVLGTVTNATLTITNDNNYGQFEFSAPAYAVNEATNGVATVTVIRTGSALSNATINFTTMDGTAHAGANYIATNGAVSFVQGQTAASFGVRILNDGIVDPSPFFFNVVLTNASTGAVLGSPTNAQVNILDAQAFNRPPGSGDVTFNQTGINGSVQAIALQTNGQIVAGGNFTDVDGLPRNHYVRLNTDGTLDTSFLNGFAGADGAVSAVAVQTDGAILLGGSFGNVDSVVRNRIARVQVDGSLDTSFNPGSGADNPVFAIAETFIGGAREIYVGGGFTTLNADGIPGIGRLNEDGTVDPSFVSTGVNGTVNAIAVYPTNSVLAGKVLIGGAFTSVNGVNQTNIVRLNVDGSLDTNFNASADGSVRAIAIQNDGGIVLGGDFANVDGVAAVRVARLNGNGSVDSTFAANTAFGANDSVQAIALQSDNRILIGGQFTSLNGVTRNHITRLLTNGLTDPTINFGDGANGDIDAVVVQPVDQMILIGGGFTQYDDVPAPFLTRIYGGSATGSGAFQFTSTNYVVNENGLQAIITVRRTGGTSGPNPDGSGNVSVVFSTTPGSAAPTVNYTTVVTNVSFPPGEVLENVAVPVRDDNVVTSNLTVNLTLSNPSAGTQLGNQTNAVLTIVNTDNTISFSSATYQVAKNTLSGLANITIVRSGGGNQPCTVGFGTTTNGTAAIGTDYFPTNVLVTFSPGVTQQVVQVAITNNALPEGDRTVTMILSNAIGTTLVSPSNAVLTIKDTAFSPGQLMFSSTNFAASEGTPNAIITVLRTNGSSGSVSAFYYTVPGTAQPGVSYISVSNTITFNDGQTSGTFAVPLVQNNLVLGTVNFGVVLVTNLSSGTTLVSPTNAIVSIADDNSGFLLGNATNSVPETTSPLGIQVLRIGPTNGTESVSYSTHDGTAVAGTNYTTTAGTLTFNPGEAIKSILIPIIHDPAVTGTLQFTLALSNPSTGSALGYPSTNYIEVLDADAGISFTNSSMIVRRDIGNALITVICTNPSVEPVINNSNTVPLSVQFATSDGTALNGLDYIKTNGTLVFTNGNGTNTFTVPILNSGTVSGDRTFNISLANPTPPGQLIAPSNMAVTIIDATAGFKFSSKTYSVNKTAGISMINVFRTGLTDAVATIQFSATNGSAIPGIQYFPTNGTLLFTNGVTNQTFSVPIVDTSVVQPNVTVLLQLFNPSNGVLASPNAATLTIKDNTGSFVVPAGSALISESGAGAPNGVIDSNETVTVLFGFRDAGGLNVGNLSATLIATNGVTPIPNPATQTYGPLLSGGHSVSEPFTFLAQGTNGQQITATFQLKDSTTNIGTAVFGYTLGTTTVWYTNAGFIAINDNATATPYPSTITVSNQIGTILKSTVTLTNLVHTSPADIDALLVSPEEQTVLFMAHAGGQNAINGVTLTFDDAASASLPQSGQILSGTNKPTAYLPVPVFP